MLKWLTTIVRIILPPIFERGNTIPALVVYSRYCDRGGAEMRQTHKTAAFLQSGLEFSSARIAGGTI